MSAIIEVKYFNSFWLKKAVPSTTPANNFIPVWPGLPWNPSEYPAFPFGDSAAMVFNSATPKCHWYLEEARIKGGYNNTNVAFGVRAYTVDKNVDKRGMSSGLIFSGLYNSKTGYNRTNVFSIGENITKEVNPAAGTIQKLYAEDSNLLIFQENKVNKALINKNTIYSGDQGAAETSSISVIGQIVPYLGEYGISKNPESFAIYGYRKYFTDKNRSAVLRLSRDGITEISSYGMRDYFRDSLAAISDEWERQVFEWSAIGAPATGVTIFQFLTDDNCCDIPLGAAVEFFNAGAPPTTTSATLVDLDCSGLYPVATISTDLVLENKKGYFVVYTKGKATGGWDIHNQNYVLSIQKNPRFISTASSSFNTSSFDESVNGWTSFYSYKPEFVGSLKNKFYSLIESEIYEHYDITTVNNRGKFYGATTSAESSITFIFNPNPSVTKNFNTVSYEGSNGWQVDYFKSDVQQTDPDIPFTTPYTYGNANEYQDVTNSVKSYNEGEYQDGGITYYAGFNRKENRYVARLVSASVARPGEVIFGSQVSGIKGYFSTVKVSTDTTTQPGGLKELFAVASNYVISSY